MLPKLTWIDLEMTGLNPETEVIIEIAVIITDGDLNIIEETPSIAIQQPKKYIDAMDEWNTKHHYGSGLVDRVFESKKNTRQIEIELIQLLQQHIKPNQSPLCGNSIGHDRRFLVKYMPTLEKYLHYRNIDVSSIKELAKRWKPEIIDGFSKENNHTALSDIKESIAELKYYRKHFFSI